MANYYERFDPPPASIVRETADSDEQAQRMAANLSAAGKKFSISTPSNYYAKFDQAPPPPAAKPVPVAPGQPPVMIGGRLGVHPQEQKPDAGARLLSGLDRAPYDFGGAVTDKLAGHVPAEVAGAAGYGANMIGQVAPMFAGGAVGKIAAPPIRAGAEKLMWSALKPSMEEIRSGKAVKAIDTLLNEGISVTKGGVAKLKAKISDLNDQIAKAIEGSTATVDKQAAASEMKGLLSRVEKQVNPQADTATVKQAWDEFLNHPLLAGERMPVQLAQEMKQGTYRALGDKAYGELKGASIEGQKTLARGLKDQIAKEVPEVGPLNAKESELLNALTPTEYRVLTNMKNNPGGLAWLTTNPKEFAAFMADRSPAFKSLLARFMNSQGTGLAASAGRIGGGALGMQQGQIPPPP